MQAVRSQVEHHWGHGEALQAVAPEGAGTSPVARKWFFPPSEQPGRVSGDGAVGKASTGLGMNGEAASPGVEPHVPGRISTLSKLRVRIARAIEYVRALSDVDTEG